MYDLFYICLLNIVKSKVVMKKIPLLPRYFRWIGVVVFLLGCFYNFYGYLFDESDLTRFSIETFVFYHDTPMAEGVVWFGLSQVDFGLTFLLTMYLVGLTFIAFAKNKAEDEMINSIRLYSWSWAIIIIILFSFISTLFVYGMAYLSFVFLYVQLLLLIYIFIFWINIWKMNRRGAHEE